MTHGFTALIVDDEPLAREGIRLHLEDQPDIHVVAEASNGPDAVAAIRDLHPDLVFLDIQMPGLDGFAVLQQLRHDVLPEVIFVTAYDQFALQAFEAHALDYLLKPFDTERFGRAVNRARNQLRGRQRRDVDDRIIALLDDWQQRPRFHERLVVRSGSRILILRTDDIDWIEAAANYVKLHVGSRHYLLRETMNRLEESLDPGTFMRIHRSTIVRIERIKEIEPLFQGDHLVILQDGTRLSSSRGHRDRLQTFLENAR